MFGDGALTFREFAMREPLPLATIHDAVLEFLRDRTDAVLSGGEAVNAYVEKSQLTDDMEIMSPCAGELAVEARAFLSQRFQIASGIRRSANRLAFRVLQRRRPRDRRLVDVRQAAPLPAHRKIEDVLVLRPTELICSKVVSMVARSKTPRAFLDLADIRRLLLALPELKRATGPVARCLRSTGAAAETLAVWKEIVAQEIVPEDEDDKFTAW